MKRHHCLTSVLLPLAALVSVSVSLLVPVQSAHAQPAAPAQVAPDYSSTSGVIPWSAIMEKPLAGTANAGAPNAAQTGAADMGAADAIKGDAVKGDAKPVHEELSRSNLKDAIREFNAGEAGAKKPGDEEPAPGATTLRNPLSPAAKAAQAQANRAEWASVYTSGSLMDEVLPWAIAASSVLVLGLAVKLWLGYVRAKAARPGMRRRAARKRSERSARSLRSSASSTSSAEFQDQASASSRSPAPSDSSRQRQRSPRV